MCYQSNCHAHDAFLVKVKGGLLFTAVLRYRPTSLLHASFFPIRCEVSMWDSDQPLSRAELLKGVQEVDGLLCLLSDKIDAEVLDAAGSYEALLPMGKWVDDNFQWNITSIGINLR